MALFYKMSVSFQVLALSSGMRSYNLKTLKSEGPHPQNLVDSGEFQISSFRTVPNQISSSQHEGPTSFLLWLWTWLTRSPGTENSTFSEAPLL